MTKPGLWQLAMLMGLWAAEARVSAGATPVLAMPIRLAWNPANDPGVSGYAIYYGLLNQPATNRINVGALTTVNLQGLIANLAYRIYAVSYNSAGVESVPSNEVQLVPPAISRIQLARQSDGSMRLSARAAPGATCTVLFTPSLNPPAWQALAHTTSDQAGNVIALDASASKVKSRFYRLAVGALPLLGRMSIQREPNGTVSLAGQAPPGANCRVLIAPTPNASAWQTLSGVTADAEGRVAAVDSIPPLAKARFYRMALP